MREDVSTVPVQHFPPQRKVCVRESVFISKTIIFWAVRNISHNRKICDFGLKVILTQFTALELAKQAVASHVRLFAWWSQRNYNENYFPRARIGLPHRRGDVELTVSGSHYMRMLRIFTALLRLTTTKLNLRK